MFLYRQYAESPGTPRTSQDIPIPNLPTSHADTKPIPRLDARYVQIRTNYVALIAHYSNKFFNVDPVVIHFCLCL